MGRSGESYAKSFRLNFYLTIIFLGEIYARLRYVSFYYRMPCKKYIRVPITSREGAEHSPALTPTGSSGSTPFSPLPSATPGCASAARYTLSSGKTSKPLLRSCTQHSSWTSGETWGEACTCRKASSSSGTLAILLATETRAPAARPAPSGAPRPGRGGAGRGWGPGAAGAGTEAAARDPPGVAEKEGRAQVQLGPPWELGGPRRDCLSPPVCHPGRCSAWNSLPHLRSSSLSDGVPFPTSPFPSFLLFSHLALEPSTLSTPKAPRKNQESATVIFGGKATVPIPTLRRKQGCFRGQP